MDRYWQILLRLSAAVSWRIRKAGPGSASTNKFRHVDVIKSNSQTVRTEGRSNNDACRRCFNVVYRVGDTAHNRQ